MSPFASTPGAPARALLAALTLAQLLLLRLPAQPARPARAEPGRGGPAERAPTADELEKKIAAAPAAEKSALLLTLSNVLGSVDLGRALDAARRAQQSAAVPHDELLAAARLSTLQRLGGDYSEAYATASAALARATELGDDPARAELLLANARAHWALGDYASTMAAHQELIALAARLGDRRLVGRGHLGLSVVYGELKERAKAREEEELALAAARAIGDRELESDALNNLGNNYRAAGELARARAVHEQALAIRAAIGNRRGVGDSHINLSDVARSARDWPRALDHAERALAIYQQIGLPRYIANAHLQAASLLRDSGRLDEALARLRTGFAIAEPLASTSLLVSYHQEFALLAAARGDWRAAYDAERQRAAAADKLLNEKSRQQLAALHVRYEADRHQREIALLRGEHARQEAELRARESELLASSNALERANAMRFALGMSLLALAVALGAVILLQRVRLRAERRVLAETQSARATAEEADRVKTRFLGVASHDIRGPLGNIVNVADTLRRTPAGAAEHAERLDTITAEAQRVLVLVEDLLTIAALETGKLELRFAPMDLGEVVTAAAGSLRWQAEAKRQQLVIDSPSREAGHLEGDAARLHQVVSNLISNAIKFSPAGAAIALALGRDDSTVTLRVRDRGPGLSAADIARMFVPFQRLSTHPAAGSTSHGLGLSIAHEIVRLHGGAIRVESQAGGGATFVVELPACREQSRTASRAAS